MVEFALFFILFLVLALGLMELGLAVWTHTTVGHAARAGARYAQVHGSANPIDTDAGDLTVEQFVQSHAVGLYNGSLTVNTTYEPSNIKGAVVQVRVQYPFRLVTGGLLLSNSTMNLGSTARMVIAN